MKNITLKLALIFLSTTSYSVDKYSFGYSSQAFSDSPPSMSLSLVDDTTKQEVELNSSLASMIESAFYDSTLEKPYMKLTKTGFDNGPYKYKIERMMGISASNDYLLEPSKEIFKRCWNSLENNTENIDLAFDIITGLRKVEYNEANDLVAKVAKVGEILLKKYKSNKCDDSTNVLTLSENQIAEITELHFTSLGRLQAREQVLLHGLSHIYWGKNGIWENFGKDDLKAVAKEMVFKLTFSNDNYESLMKDYSTFIDWVIHVRSFGYYPANMIKSVGISCLEDVAPVFESFSLKSCIHNDKVSEFSFRLGAESYKGVVGGFNE